MNAIFFGKILSDLFLLKKNIIETIKEEIPKMPRYEILKNSLIRVP
tara:strand:+ start:267 stop:404 length:138 start_codon:yes stop_codon:yes gene_type:complete